MYLAGIILKAYLTGFFLTVSFGAGFFSLVFTSINKGYRKGLLIASGSILSDTLYIALCLFATSFVESELKRLETEIRIVGALVLLIMGIYVYRKTKTGFEEKDTDTKTGNWFYIMKGVMLNTVNPLIVVTWLGIVAYQETALSGFDEVMIYFAFVLVFIAFNQFLVCYSANKIKKYLSDNFLRNLNHVIGAVFWVIAVVVVWPVIQRWSF